MKPYKAAAHIHSLNVKKAEITVLEKVDDNDYVVENKGLSASFLSDCDSPYSSYQ